MTSDRTRRRATGPTSPEGKAVCATNAVRHGLRSDRAVVPAARETAETWENFHQQVAASFQPAPGVEEVLADRAAGLLWRLQRVAGFETAVLVAATEQAAEPLAGIGYGTDSPEHRLAQVIADRDRHQAEEREFAAVAECLAALAARKADAVELPPQVAEGALVVIADAGDLPGGWSPWSDEFEADVWGLDGHPTELNWTDKRLRSCLDRAARAARRTSAKLLTAARAEAEARRSASSTAAACLWPELDALGARVACATLPDGPTCDRIARYEAARGRQLAATLQHLERVQAVRAGSRIAPPAAGHLLVELAEAAEPRTG